MNEIKKMYNELNPNVQLVLWVGVAYISYLALSNVKVYIDSLALAANQNSQMNAYAQNGIYATYQDLEYEKMAAGLEKAMSGPGTDESTIFGTFRKLKNDVDFIKLDAAFGIRGFSDNLFGLLQDQNMSEWLLDDMSSSDITKLNKQLINQSITKQIM